MLTGVIGGGIAWLGPEFIDNPAAKDAVRDATGRDDEFRYTVQFLDPGFDLVLPAGMRLTDRQRQYLDRWSLDYRDPGGYSLDKLISDLRKAGGASPNALQLAITLEGQRNQPIHVDNIRPVDVQYAPPYSGTFLNIPPQGPGETVKMMFDFDELEPRARTAVDDDDGEYKPGALFFQEQTLTIEDSKQDTIFIKSIATTRAVTFDVRIDYRIGDERGHTIIDHDGHPFALSPMNCTSRSQLDPDGGLAAEGTATYDQIWALRGDFQAIDPVPGPDTFEIGYPYC